MAKVLIIMGSKSDLKRAQEIERELTAFAIASELRVASAHKAPAFLLSLLAAYEADPEPKIYITVAGRSNALSALVDAQVTSPVIACPPYSDAFGGADLFSSLRMPSGVAPAVVLEPSGAALVAAKVLALSDAAIRDKLTVARQQRAARIESDDQSLRT